jgi:SAM-dependent methyltransferase
VDTAAERWREGLASWAIPDDILRAAPESPWGCPVELFARRADEAGDRLTPSNLRALEALPEGGSVLDVGCGAGAASLPLARSARRLVGVDTSTAMLGEFRKRADRAGVEFASVEGRWPDVASRVERADVAVCHHVAYNVADLPAFVGALADHAGARVVMELTARHPLSDESDLWLRFHDVVRPKRPTADDAEAVLREFGISPGREDWESPRIGGFARREDLVAWVRRRLCLPADRDAEVWEAIAPTVHERDGMFAFGGTRRLVTLWWAASG